MLSCFAWPQVPPDSSTVKTCPNDIDAPERPATAHSAASAQETEVTIPSVEPLSALKPGTACAPPQVPADAADPPDSLAMNG